MRMFVAMLMVVGAGSALWIGLPAYRQRVAIREIERLGGSITTRKSGSTWLRRQVGDARMALFDDAIAVCVEDVGALMAIPRATESRFEPATDATMSQLGKLTELETLILNCGFVSDKGIAHLACLTKLEELFILNSPMTDIGLAHLKHLTKLQKLMLFRTHVTEAGVADLQRALPKLDIVVL